MKEYWDFSQRGQSLITVAIFLVAFIAMLVLVIDGGNAYLKRRQAQNAADAGALAGAREYCKDPNAPVGNTIAVANSYVTRNNATTVPGYPVVDTANHLVTVAADMSYNAFFGNILNASGPQSAKAIAAAGCFGACVGEGVLPVVWICNTSSNPITGPVNVPCTDLPITEDRLNEYLTDPANATDPVTGQSVCHPIILKGQTKYYCKELTIVMDNVDVDTLQCQSTGGIVDCDFDNDGTDDYISAGNRGWADLDGDTSTDCPLDLTPSEGANELISWIQNGYDCPFFPHTWVGDQTGSSLSIFQAVEARRQTEPYVVLPIFDDSCPTNPDPSSPGYVPGLCNWDPGPHPPGDLVHEFSAKKGNYYHIDRFGVFYITCVQTKKFDCPGAERFYQDNITLFQGGGDPLKGADYNAIEGYFITGYVPGLSGKCDFDPLSAYTIYLDR